MKTAITPGDLSAALSQCIGTSQYMFNPLYPRMKYTDGVKTFAEMAGAYWLLDIIGTEFHPFMEQLRAKHPTEDFATVKFTSKNGRGVLRLEDGNGSLFRQKRIDYTDCPEGEWQFFLEGDVLLVPSEH